LAWRCRIGGLEGRLGGGTEEADRTVHIEEAAGLGAQVVDAMRGHDVLIVLASGKLDVSIAVTVSVAWS